MDFDKPPAQTVDFLLLANSDQEGINIHCNDQCSSQTNEYLSLHGYTCVNTDDFSASSEHAIATIMDSSNKSGALPRPIWNPVDRTLVVREFVVKRFQRPAENQETILAVFQEENWCSRIDDPLPQVHGLDSVNRLRETIKSLNRNRRHPIIRFGGDGTGKGCRWHYDETFLNGFER